MIKLPNKLELNGADCFHLLLDNFNKPNPTSNNVIRMLITLNDRTELEKLRDNIEDSEIVQWIAQLRLERKSIKIPTWVHNPKKKKLTVVKHDHSSTFNDVKNIPIQQGKDQLIRFDILDSGNNLKLLFSWHHIIMDGRGAALLIQLLTNHESTLEIDSSFVFRHPVEKKSFKKKFARMFEVKHFVEKMQEDSMEAPQTLYPEAKGFHHEAISFSENQSKQIEQNAFAAGCRFGINNFQLACSFLAYKKVMSANKKIWVPVPYDGRKRGSKGPIIGNHISFLFYQINPKDFTNPKEIVASLNEQMSNQLKQDIPSKYNDMLSLMRKFPLWFNKWVTTRSSKGRVSSFLYSSSGQGVWDTNQFDKSFKDVLLIPPFANNPGLTFTFSRFNGAIKLNIVACKKKFDDKKLSLIRETIKNYLLEAKKWKN
jgi:NRPS condensation-like uncharacterized protein